MNSVKLIGGITLAFMIGSSSLSGVCCVCVGGCWGRVHPHMSDMRSCMCFEDIEATELAE